MFDSDGKLSLGSVIDPRLRAALLAATERPGVRLGPVDLIAGVIASRDPSIDSILKQALRPNSTLSDFLSAPSTPATQSRTRGSFSAASLSALDESGILSRQAGGKLNDANLELLLHRILLVLDPADREALSAFDLQLAEKLLRERVALALGARPGQPREGNPDDPTDADPSPDELDEGPFEDLTARIHFGGLPKGSPFDGDAAYETVFESLVRSLHRRKTRHVLLTGERGVGKASLIAELARRAALGNPAFLREATILYTDCRHIPPDDARPHFSALLVEVVGRADVVVAIDGFASLLRADRTGGIKAVLLTALASARCRLIALLAPREYEDLIADDPDYAEFFTRVDVPEPDTDAAIRLLNHFASSLEAQFGVGIDPLAIQRAVRLSSDFVLNDHLPGKAVSILQRVCEDIEFDRTQRGSPRTRVTEGDVIRAVSDASGVPEETLLGVAGRSDYEQSLGDAVYGQPKAVREVAAELGLIKAGMTDPTKPAGVFLFLGQTGTGKTELAKALARFYSTSKRLKTYALGNCIEPHSVATIIGVPPGYVGHDQGGRLVTELNADPYGVFLLDEADKAHPDVLQPFLNLFDEGWISDQRGVRAYAGKSIFVLTSNVGQRMIADWFAQGLSADEVMAKVKDALPQIRHGKLDRPVFAPEFLARVKRVIVFQPLGREAMDGIARKQVREIQRTWTLQRGKDLIVSDALIEAIAEKAHASNEASKGKEGGRVVRRFVADWIESPLQRAMSLRPDEYKTAERVELIGGPDGDGARVVFGAAGESNNSQRLSTVIGG